MNNFERIIESRESLARWFCTHTRCIDCYSRFISEGWPPCDAYDCGIDGANIRKTLMYIYLNSDEPDTIDSGKAQLGGLKPGHPLVRIPIERFKELEIEFNGYIFKPIEVRQIDGSRIESKDDFEAIAKCSNHVGLEYAFRFIVFKDDAK